MKAYVFESMGKKILYIDEISCYLNIEEMQEIGLGWQELSEDVINMYIDNEELSYIVKYYDELKNVLNNKKSNSLIKGGQYTLCLHPSNKCNLRCKYCFRDEKCEGNYELTFEMAKNAIDYMVYDYAKNASKYIIDLSGAGEPLLNFDLIKRIVEYCDQIQDKIGRSVAVMFVSNGNCNITNEQREFLKDMIIGVSLDGDSLTHDRIRLNYNQKGTYQKAIDFISGFQNKKFGIATTITPLNQEVDKIFEHISHINNVECIGMKFVRCFDNSEMDVKHFDIEKIVKSYEKLCDNIFKHLEENNTRYILMLLKGNDFFGNYIVKSMYQNMQYNYRCDAGRRRISVDNEGNIYPCSVLNGKENMHIGSIYDGIDINRQKKFLIPNEQRMDKCCKCWASKICGGECYAIREDSNKEQLDKMCLIKKELIKLSMAFVLKLKSLYKEKYYEIARFVLEKDTYQNTDPGVWACFRYLQLHEYNISFKKICNDISFGANGVEPYNLKRYLSNYIKNVKIYQLDDIEMFHQVNTPCIAILNKFNKSMYDYIIIKNIYEENIQYENLLGEECFVSKNDFIQIYSNIVMF